MDAELKKKILLIFKYLDIKGCRYAEKEGDYYSMNFHDQNNQWWCVTKTHNRNLIRLPLDISQELEVLIDNHQNEFSYFGDDPYGFEVRLYPDTKTISVYEQYSEYQIGDTQTVTVDIEQEPEVKQIIDHYCKKEEICRGNITFQFHGGGDSGYIEDSGTSDFDGPAKIYEPAEDMFYRMLSINFGGWEINEGSQGDCIIDMDLEQLQLDFEQNYEESKSDEVWSMSLEDDLNEDWEKVKVTPGKIDDENEDIMFSAVKKLLESLFFNGLNVFYQIYRMPHRDNKDYISVDIDVDVSRILDSHKNYDEKYAEVIYDLEHVIETVEKYLGIQRQIYIGISYFNHDFLDDEAHYATQELHEELIKSDVFTTAQANDTWINIHYREDDYPAISIEAGGHDIPNEESDLFENTVWNIVQKYKHLSMLAYYNDIEWWINY
jgi:hypothetical protein